MSHSTSGLYSSLQSPRAYGLFQSLVSRKDARRIIADQYIRPQSGNRIVDIGCGPGTMLLYLGAVDYTGFDLNGATSSMQRKRFPGRAPSFKAASTTPLSNWNQELTSLSPLQSFICVEKASGANKLLLSIPIISSHIENAITAIDLMSEIR